MTDDLDEALAPGARGEARDAGRCRSALVGNAAEVLPELVAPRRRARRAHRPDLGPRHAQRLRPAASDRRTRTSTPCAATIPRSTSAGPWSRSASTCGRCWSCKQRGAVTFDYGNNLRAQAVAGGRGATPSTSPASCPSTSGRCSARARGRSAGWPCPATRRTSTAPTRPCWRRSRDDESLARWITLAREKVQFQGLPARICWLGYGERAKLGLRFNDMVRRGELKAPIVIGRDHLDAGSVASPNRETEAMKDGSDAIADWPILNALINTACGAGWVSVHHGGGVGIGYSLHAGMVVVADGSDEAERRLRAGADQRPGDGRDPPRRCRLRGSGALRGGARRGVPGLNY